MIAELQPELATDSTAISGCERRMVMRLPVSGPPLVLELAFPDGMDVFVGPHPGHFGKIDWSANPILSLPSKYHGGTDMRRDYAPCVPVRPRGLIGRVTWHDVRWVIPHNKETKTSISQTQTTQHDGNTN